GIRDFHVTGVQTCALPISRDGAAKAGREKARAPAARALRKHLCRKNLYRRSLYRKKSMSVGWMMRAPDASAARYEFSDTLRSMRSEERRVGNECKWHERRV